MQREQGIKTLMQEIHGGKAQPVLDLAQKRPEDAAALSKLLEPSIQSPIDLSRPETMMGMDQSRMLEISDRITERSRDSDNIVSLFPETELCIQLVASSIVSPKDMVSQEIIYKAREAIFPASVLAKMNSVVQSNIEGHYKLKDNLYDIVRDAMFMDGCYVKMTLPESTVDYVINAQNVVATEAIKDIFTGNKFVYKGFLGNEEKKVEAESFSLESMDVQTTNNYESRVRITKKVNYTEKKEPAKGDQAERLYWATEQIDVTDQDYIPGLEIIDNFEAVRLPVIQEHNTKMRIRENLLKTFSRRVPLTPVASAVEDVVRTGLRTEYNAAPINVGAGNVKSLVYGNRPMKTQLFSVIQDPEHNPRRSIGRPLTLRLPACSVIPAYVPGNEKNHIAYFVLLDGNGNPLNEDNKNEALGRFQDIANQNQQLSLTSQIIDRAAKSLVKSTSREPVLMDIEKVFNSIVENSLLRRLKNGVMGDNVQLSNNEDIYRIMLARCYSGQQTRVMFVPAELITYYAFKYFNNGVGKSYMDDIKILISMRAAAKLSKLMAQLKSAIAITHVNVELDPRDPDPLKTVEMITHEIARVRSNYLPLGTVSPTLLTDWIKRAGIEIQFTNHPKLPTTKIDFESRNYQPVQPDDALDESLRRETYMAFALTPEMVDETLSPQFATSITNQSTLFSKRVMLWQAILVKFLTKEAQTYGRYDGKIYEELKTVIKENIGLIEAVLTDEDKALKTTNEEALYEVIIERFIENLELDLPKPDTTSLANQMQAFDDYIEAVEKTIKSWIGEEIIANDVNGELTNNITTVANQYKHHLIRQYMIKEGLMPEMADIIKTDDEGQPSVDLGKIVTDHNKQLMLSVVKYLKENLPIKLATDEDLAKMGTPEGEATSSSSSSTDTSDDGGGGGDDDLGLGGGMGGINFGGGDDLDAGGGGEGGEGGEGGGDDTSDPLGGTGGF